MCLRACKFLDTECPWNLLFVPQKEGKYFDGIDNELKDRNIVPAPTKNICDFNISYEYSFPLILLFFRIDYFVDNACSLCIGKCEYKNSNKLKNMCVLNDLKQQLMAIY